MDEDGQGKVVGRKERFVINIYYLILETWPSFAAIVHILLPFFLQTISERGAYLLCLSFGLPHR
jgi:hypothetical protein